MNAGMRSLCITRCLSRNAGGLFESVRRLHVTLTTEHGVDVQVHAGDDPYAVADAPEWQPLEPAIYRTRGPAEYGLSPGMLKGVLRDVADIAHLHGIWTFSSVVTRAWAARRGLPYVVSTHGMVDPWALSQHATRKRAALWAVELGLLRRAACLRALNNDEAIALRRLCPRTPIAVIPNGVDLPVGTYREETPWPQVSRSMKVLLFLGRINPKKNIKNLILAWQELGSARDNWILAIAGWDDSDHLGDLREACAQGMGAGESVLFLGPKWGRDKAACFQNASGFVLPSLSEGLPMAVLEAWSHGLPVLMSRECNLGVGFAERAAVRVGITVEEIQRGLREFLALPENELAAMGQRGEALVRRAYTWRQVATEMVNLYRWASGDRTAESPRFFG